MDAISEFFEFICAVITGSCNNDFHKGFQKCATNDYNRKHCVRKWFFDLLMKIFPKNYRFSIGTGTVSSITGVYHVPSRFRKKIKHYWLSFIRAILVIIVLLLTLLIGILLVGLFILAIVLIFRMLIHMFIWCILLIFHHILLILGIIVVLWILSLII